MPERRERGEEEGKGENSLFGVNGEPENSAFNQDGFFSQWLLVFIMEKKNRSNLRTSTRRWRSPGGLRGQERCLPVPRNSLITRSMRKNPDKDLQRGHREKILRMWVHLDVPLWVFVGGNCSRLCFCRGIPHISSRGSRWLARYNRAQQHPVSYLTDINYHVSAQYTSSVQNNSYSFSALHFTKCFKLKTLYLTLSPHTSRVLL